MKGILLSFLHEYSKKTVSLGELEKLAGGDTCYQDFAVAIVELTKKGILQPIKSHGTSLKNPHLHNSYRIVKSKLPVKHHQHLTTYQLQLDPHIDLSPYYTLPASVWDKDLPYIELIDTYLKQHGLPNSLASLPERSYQLVGNEKWIEEGGGKALLERINLWEAMQVMSQPDPMMLAINHKAWHQDILLHLVVENKTPFHALLDTLPDTRFLSLIYGAGWKVTADIVLLDKQLGTVGRPRRIYYFGDLDYEGISIWYALYTRADALPAVPFYQAFLSKTATQGKEYQHCNDEALQVFLSFFSPDQQEQIVAVLKSGSYYPQEGLNSTELADIWRNSVWT
ncbi:MAG TPA: DUF2399 domain-containing protein [Syntrophomonadaceae bacterium]|nr:DUF2399 domain-containing protein [Syntrophomonadaceae bacterium]HQA06776.1 DUF2399 domain-containing protein [Syntrophomonadaceae bacterium]HQE22857.1 DUF2399 domain-containing protein [Syntrophomonadaceae bacterium]